MQGEGEFLFIISLLYVIISSKYEEDHKLNENFLVSKSNYLIEAIWKLGELEQKIINLIISEINSIEDLELKYYEFKITDFMKLLGIEGKGKYADIPDILGLDLENGIDMINMILSTDLPKATKGLMSKTVTIIDKDSKKLKQMHWVDYVEYGDGVVKIRIGSELKPYLLQLKNGHFTEYQLKNILPMSSKYAIRLYEIIKSYEYKPKKEFTFDVDKIKEILDIKEEYQKYNDFKKYVIITAQEEINAKSDILFSFEEIKKGKKVVSIKFIITSKENIKKEIAITAIDPDDEAIKKVNEIMDNRVNDKDAKTLYLKSNKNLDKIKLAYDACKAKEDRESKELNNLTGYMIKLLAIEKIEPPKPNLSKPKRNPNRTNSNFEQRNYTKKQFADLEKKLLGRDDDDKRNEDQNEEYEEENDEILNKDNTKMEDKNYE